MKGHRWSCHVLHSLSRLLLSELWDMIGPMTQKPQKGLQKGVKKLPEADCKLCTIGNTRAHRSVNIFRQQIHG